MHAFDKNALLTMIAINKLTDQTGPEKIPEMDTIPPPPPQCGSKHTHAAVPEKLSNNFFLPNWHTLAKKNPG